MRAGRAFVIAACFAAGCLTAAACRAEDIPQGSGFDFYVLSLSWSPSYCAAEGADANPTQCGPGRPYAFIVHGLWPQFESGDYPTFCATRDPDRVPKRLVARLLDLMPTAGLIGHQWRKHGSCSGLGQEDYFRVVRAARDRVAVPAEYRRTQTARTVDPDEVEADFMEANPGLPAEGIAVTCDGTLLREVRLCMTKDLAFRACAEVDASSCRADEVLMPPSLEE